MDFLLLYAGRHTTLLNIKSFYVSIWGVHYHDFWCCSKYFSHFSWSVFSKMLHRFSLLGSKNIKSKLWSVFHHFLLPQFASIFCFYIYKFLCHKPIPDKLFPYSKKPIGYTACWVRNLKIEMDLFILLQIIKPHLILTSSFRRLPEGSKRREMSQNLRAASLQFV